LSKTKTRPILFYDGSCKFCNRSVSFILKNESDKTFLFAHLQEKGVQEFLEQKNGGPLVDSIYILDEQNLLKYSDASIKIAEHLIKPHFYLSYVKKIPRPLRDLGYKIIASIRYKIAGKLDQCIYPGELQGRLFTFAKDLAN
jgi:predicted DCC family thiol-disulfide oxidoreductase YuxK